MKKLILLLVIISFLGCKKEEPCIPQYMHVSFEPVQETGYLYSFINECEGFNTLLWDFGDGQTSENKDYIVYHEYEHPGTYLVTLYAEDICGNGGFASQEVMVSK